MKVFFDTETTGLPNWKSPEKNTPRMVQLGLIVTDDFGVIRETLGIIFKSEGYTISKEASDIHGITDEIANTYGVNRSHEFFCRLFDIFHNANEIIAHNYSFDKLIINGEFLRLGLGKIDDSKSFCTKEASADVCKITFISSHTSRFGTKETYKWPKLVEVYEFLFNENIVGTHDALTDVRATMRVYFELKRRYHSLLYSKSEELPLVDTGLALNDINKYPEIIRSLYPKEKL